MARLFVSDFLLPLVHGGILKVGRPLFPRDVDGLMRVRAKEGAREIWDDHSVSALRSARRRALLALVPDPPVARLDEESWRLGAAVHDLLALAHPRIGTGPGAASRIERVAAAAEILADLGAPPTMGRALRRHSLVARLPEVIREDHTVQFWLGRRTFVGRRPPARMLALPRLRAVKVQSTRRSWLRDVGILAAARPAFAKLTEASPLGEALDPLRLDPSWSWGRVLSILKFPALCRLVAGRLVELGVGRTGDALTEALYRFVSLQDAGGPVRSSPEAVAFAIAFLAHLTWLDLLFQPTAMRTGPAPAAGDVGRDLAVLLAAAQRVERKLIWPPDIERGSDVGRAFERRLDQMFARHDVGKSSRWPAALDVAKLAAVAGRSPTAGHAV